MFSTRAFVWAAYAYGCQQELRRRWYELHGTVRGAVPRSVTIEDPSAARTPVRSPRTERLANVEEICPGTRQVFDHPLWKIVDPESDLLACYRARMGLAQRLSLAHDSNPLRAFEMPDAEASLDVLAVLCACLRLVKHAGDVERAFLIGCDIVRAMCYLSLARPFQSSIIQLSEVIVRSLLGGLELGSKRLSAKTNAYSALYDVLARMQRQVNAATGMPSLVHRGPHPWATYITLLGPVIDAFCSADAGKQDAAQDAMDTAFRQPSISPELRKRAIIFETSLRSR